MNAKTFKSILVSAVFVGLYALSVGRVAAQSTAQGVSASPGATVAARITKAVDESRLVQLKGNVHPIAKAKYDQGAVSDSAPVTRALVLLQRSADQEAALRQLLDDQQNQSTANFHNWLTPQQYAAQYGPADSDVQTVTQWLSSHGFQNISVSAGKTAIEFSGNVGQIRSAFHTDIHKYLYKGETHNANVSDPQIPEALAPVVAGVVGLHNFPPRAHVHRAGTFRRDKSTGQIKPLYTFSGGICNGSGNCYGVGPADFATIYNVGPLYTAGITGSGVTIAVVGDSNINAADVSDFRTMFGLSSNFTAASNIIVNGPDPGLTDDEIEADLDTQWAGAVAPAAKVILVVTEQPETLGVAGVDLSALYVIDTNQASVMSKSFGSCEFFQGNSGNMLESALAEQAAAQGITLMVSAGDSGSAGCDPTSSDPDVASLGLAVSGDAATPFNVAVGGTDFNQSASNILTYWNNTNTGTPATSSAKSYIPEVTWNATCAFAGASGCTPAIVASDSAKQAGIDVVAGSGGKSGCQTQNSSGACTAGYAKPSWQVGTGVPADGVRDIPDLSLFASSGTNGSFYIICQQDANAGSGSSTSSCDLNATSNDFQGVGGTSASSPSFAGIVALVNQSEAAQGRSARQGNINYVLYAMATANAASCTANASTCVFHDTQGTSNNSVACQGGSPNCSSTSASGVGIMSTSAGGTTPAYQTTAGYDLATGLGSVNAANLVNNWAAASFRPSTTSFTLNSGIPVITTHGTSINVSGSVARTSGAGTPTGYVELIQGGTAPGTIIDTFVLSSTGVYSGTTEMLPATNGTSYTVIAHYGGDGTFAGSSSSTQSVVTVGKEASKIAVGLVTFDSNNNPVLPPVTASTSLTYGTAYILQIAVTNSSGSSCAPPPFSPSVPCPSGSVTLLDGGAALNDFVTPNTTTPTNTAKLNNAGIAEDQPIQLTAGSHTITATYAGDSNFNAPTSASNTLSITITQAATQTNLAASPSSITSGGTVTLTAIVATNSNSSVGPTGTVGFTKNGSTLSAGATCVPTGATSTAAAFCTATITTSLSMLMPPGNNLQRRPGPPTALIFLLVAMALVMAYTATQITSSRARRLAYASILFLIAGAVGVAGCGGGSGGGGGSTHTDTVTASYSGDTNYAASNSTVSVTVTVP